MVVGGLSEVSRPANFARQQAKRRLTQKQNLALVDGPAPVAAWAVFIISNTKTWCMHLLSGLAIREGEGLR